MTTIEDVMGRALAYAMDDTGERGTREQLRAAIEQYAAERVAEETAVPAPPFDPAFEPPWHRSDGGPAEARKSAEPVAWIHPSYLRNRTYEYRVAPFKTASELVPLYAAPPKCGSLTDEQIAEIVKLRVQIESLVKDIKAADALLTSGDDSGALAQVRIMASRASQSYLDCVGRAAVKPNVTGAPFARAIERAYGIGEKQNG